VSDRYAVKQCGDLTIRELPGPRFVVIGHGSERIGPAVDSLKAAEAQVRKHQGTEPVGSDEADVGAVQASAPPELPTGFTIKRRGRWHTLYDADDNKIGSGKTHEEAVALAGD